MVLIVCGLDIGLSLKWISTLLQNNTKQQIIYFVMCSKCSGGCFVKLVLKIKISSIESVVFSCYRVTVYNRSAPS